MNSSLYMLFEVDPSTDMWWLNYRPFRSVNRSDCVVRKYHTPFATRPMYVTYDIQEASVLFESANRLSGCTFSGFALGSIGLGLGSPE